MNVEEFRRHGHQLIDWIADCREKIQAGKLPVMAGCAPGALKAQLPSAAPESPEPFEALAQDLAKLILPACTHFQSPGFYGFFPSNSSLAAGSRASTSKGFALAMGVRAVLTIRGPVVSFCVPRRARSE